MTDPRPEIVCLCGSTRFIDTFQAEYARLTDEGRIVLTVGRVVPQSEQALGSGRKVALDALHLRKIDIADRVLVLNVGGYVGPSTRREIAYATEHGKPVDLLYPEAGLDGPTPSPAANGQAIADACARVQAWEAAFDSLRDNVLHNADGLDSDIVNAYLGRIDDADPRPYP